MRTPSSKKRLLVTGASGFLGYNVCSVAADHYEVHGTYNTHTYAIDGVIMHKIDCTDRSTLRVFLAALAPDAIIHTAAAADPNFCQTHPELSKKINVHTPALFARICSEMGIPFIFTSSDLVFDGKNAPYAEDDLVCPLSFYGEQKVIAEQEIHEEYARAVICRMPLMYGDAPPHAKSFIHPMIAALKSGTTLNLFTDEFRTPCSARDAATGLLVAMEHPEAGILHLGGPQRLSRYEMGHLIANALGITPAIIATSQKDLQMAAPRAADVSMTIDKALRLGFSPQTMESRLPELSIIKNSRIDKPSHSDNP